MLVAAFFFAVMGVLVKIASHKYSSAELVFYRSLVGLIFISSYVWQQSLSLKTNYFSKQMSRSIIGFISMVMFFFAIAELQHHVLRGDQIAGVTCPDTHEAEDDAALVLREHETHRGPSPKQERRHEHGLEPWPLHQLMRFGIPCHEVIRMARMVQAIEREPVTRARDARVKRVRVPA